MPHIAIAGAGLAGRLLGWRMARAGWRVSLFDTAARDDTGSASHVAAAMLAPLAERASCSEEVFGLARRAMSLWPAWVDELQADSGRAVYFRREGTLVVAHPADAGTLGHFHGRLQHQLGAGDRERVQPLDAEGVAALEPALAGRFRQGLFLSGEGQLANDELLAALAVVLLRSPHAWHERCPVHALGQGVLHSAQGACRADVVVDTRGVGARADWPGLRGVRGEVLTVECRGVGLARPVRLMHPRYQLYIVPRPGHRFVVGATELESEDNGSVTLRSMLELGSALYSLHPGFGEARVLQAAAALRPAFDDNDPVLRQQQGVWQLNGLYRHGYLCAPALVDTLAENLVRAIEPVVH
jgi:glycine oxidase